MSFKSKIIDIHLQHPLMTTIEIAAAIGCCTGMVRTVRTKMNIPIPRSNGNRTRAPYGKLARWQLTRMIRRQEIVWRAK